MIRSLALFMFALLLPLGAAGQEVAPHAIDIPSWFATTFLDLREDIADAAKHNRRLLVYFGQDGCPYCKRLMTVDFTQRGIVDKTRRHFVAIALDMWGDREVTWIDGRVTTEKKLALELEVQFTPTILFFDEQGAVVARLNGYYPPPQFERVLDYVAGHHERTQSLSDYAGTTTAKTSNAQLQDEPFFMRAPYDLRRRKGKPLAVIFETIDCSECDELHRDGLRRDEVRALLNRFDVARFALGSSTPLVTPNGEATDAQRWARELDIVYAPTVVLFDAQGREVFRIEAYMRPFHLASSLDYVASGAYLRERSFQRFIRARAERTRARGGRVDLWE